MIVHPYEGRTAGSLFVVDATVVGKWHLKDEIYASHARNVLYDYGAENIQLIAPDSLYYEVGSILSKAVVQNIWSLADAVSAYQEFIDLKIPTYPSSLLAPAAMEISRRVSCSFYDGLYLALAEMMRRPFVHADQKLHDSGFGVHFAYELWIADYKSPI